MGRHLREPLPLIGDPEPDDRSILDQTFGQRSRQQK